MTEQRKLTAAEIRVRLLGALLALAAGIAAAVVAIDLVRGVI
jgi:hypothetical protein